MREFETAPEGSLAGERHERGAQLGAYLPDSWEGAWHGKGQHHAKGRFFLQNELQIEFAKPKFCSFLRLPSAIQGTRYCQSKAPR